MAGLADEGGDGTVGLDVDEIGFKIAGEAVTAERISGEEVEMGVTAMGRAVVGLAGTTTGLVDGTGEIVMEEIGLGTALGTLGEAVVVGDGITAGDEATGKPIEIPVDGVDDVTGVDGITGVVTVPWFSNGPVP